MTWTNIDKARSSAHYSIMRLTDGDQIGGMAALRELFPDGIADEMNAALFSTSGVHGTYNTIEEAERGLTGEKDEEGYGLSTEVTFLVLHPRLVALRYGTCQPKTPDDIVFLKRLRETSHKALAGIGMLGGMD